MIRLGVQFFVWRKEMDLYITKLLTGHMYYSSPYESCDSCGNCNGARCDNCHERYQVIDFDSDGASITFKTRKEAEEYRDKRMKGEK